MADMLKKALPHSFRLKTSIIGSGLCVFSRFPIISVNGHQYSVSGTSFEITDGEIFAGKGVLSCRIMTPAGPLLFVTTHLNSRWKESQTFELTQFIGNARGNDIVILCGDFNTLDNHPAYRLITTYLGLQDAFAGCSANTCNLRSNTYTKKTKTPCRIDYVFYSSDRCPTAEMDVQSKKLSLSGNIPGKDFPYSDHEGLEVVFEINERATPLSSPQEQLLLSDEAVEVLNEIAQRIHDQKKKFQVMCPHHRVVITAIGLVIFLLLLSLVLGNSTIATFISTHYLGFFMFTCVGICWAGSVMACLIPMFRIHHVNGMESHIRQIHARLGYNRSLDFTIAAGNVV
jgi:sphingomyelin phosphodiesterase 2